MLVSLWECQYFVCVVFWENDCVERITFADMQGARVLFPLVSSGFLISLTHAHTHAQREGESDQVKKHTCSI